MAYFDELLQRAITVRNNRAPASNTADLVGGVLVGIVTALQMLLDDKQDELTFDTAPTADSQNPVTSDGIYQALQAIDLSACEKIVNKVTSINAQSTDVQYPSAKLLYDSLQALSGIYAPKVHTHPFADIERPANVASVNAQGYTITTAYYSHVLTITADATLHLPTMQSGAAIILRLTIIQDATGGRAVTFDGGAALVFNPYQTDLSLGQANYRCWVVLWFDGVNWAWLASPYVLRAESQFAYTIDGTTGGQYVTVTINGTTMQIQATGGVWQYGYNNPINSIAFTGDTGVLNVDFTNSDGLANITTLADAFKNCAALVAVDFTGCDLSNVATAADCFAGCTSLAALTIPTGTWKPDIDLSACAAFTKAAMLSVIDGLYTYASGTHTITFNSTIWDALSVAQQQTIFDAAQLKGWTTNAVAVVYHIKGTATSATVTIHIDNSDVIVNVVNGEFDYEYLTPITSLAFGDITETTHDEFLTIDLSDADDFTALLNCNNFLRGCRQLTRIDAPQTFENVTTAERFFWICGNALEINMPNATFELAYIGFFIGALYPKDKTLTLPSFIGGFAGAVGTFIQNCQNLEVVNLPSATFANITTSNSFIITTPLKELLLPSATFASVTNAANMFNSQSNNLRYMQKLDLTMATFASCTDCSRMFYYVGYQSANYSQLEINMPNATFANVSNAQYMFGAFGGVKINMPNATFGTYGNFQYFANEMAHCAEINFASFTAQYATTLDRWFNQDTALQTLVLPNTALCNVTVPLPSSPLSYQSMLTVANWLKDLTGQTAQSVTFKTSAWNALTAAEQNNIDTILSGKNWTRVLAA